MGNGIGELNQRFVGFIDVTKIDDELKKKVIDTGFKLDWNGIFKEECARLEQIVNKFTFQASYKVIVHDYEHREYLNQFFESHKNKQDFVFNDLLKDQSVRDSFIDVGCQLKPGYYLVPVWSINDGAVVSSQEILTFLSINNVQLPGMDGIAMFWEQNGEALLKGKAYIGFDKKDNLPIVDGDTCAPFIYCDYNGDYRFHPGHFRALLTSNYFITGLHYLGPDNLSF